MYMQPRQQDRLVPGCADHMPIELEVAYSRRAEGFGQDDAEMIHGMLQERRWSEEKAAKVCWS